MGGGGVLEAPRRQDFYTPTLIYTTPTPRRVFSGVGRGGVSNLALHGFEDTFAKVQKRIFGGPKWGSIEPLEVRLNFLSGSISGPSGPKCPGSVPESVPENWGSLRECPTGCLWGPSDPGLGSVQKVSRDCPRSVCLFYHEIALM